MIFRVITFSLCGSPSSSFLFFGLVGECLCHAMGWSMVAANGAPCTNETVPGAFLYANNPVDAPSPYNTFDFGTDSNSTDAPGVFRLCWSAVGAADAQSFWVVLGQLTLGGPVRADYNCVLGSSCSLVLSGTFLSASDRLAVISLGSCGWPHPTFTTQWTNLLQVNPVAPADAGLTYKMGTGASLSTAGVPGTAQLCWASAPGASGYDVFTVELGTFTMDGPIQNVHTTCRLCSECNFDVQGIGLQSNDKVLIIFKDGT